MPLARLARSALLVALYAAASTSAYPALLARDAVTECAQDIGQVDYVVVGGGVGGLSLGVRLSEDPSITVAVIEAGPYEPELDGVNIPALKGSVIGTTYDWNYTTIPQEHLHNRTISWPRGKILGGSGALNLLVWDRASDVEYDAIASTAGSDLWSAENTVEYMKRTENYQQIPSNVESEYDAMLDDSRFGVGGPISFGLSPVVPEYQKGWIPALNSLGINTNNASLSGNPVGVCWQPTNVLYTNYTRAYAPPAYYAPNEYRTNLKVLVNSTVTKINWKDNCDKLTAESVTVSTPKGEATVSVGKELVLSAGSVGTPQLLELSGVGRKDVLEPLGIDVKHELLGVGENLHDHIRIQNVYTTKSGLYGLDRIRFDTEYADEQLEIYRANNGTLSEYDYTASGYAFLTIDQFAPELKDKLVGLAKQAVKASKTELGLERNKQTLSFIENESSVPQIEIIFSDGYTGSKTVAERYDNNTYSLIAALLHPFSRGSIHINTTDPNDKPVINPNYFEDEYDIQMLKEVAKYMRKIAQTDALAQYTETEYEPGYDLVTDDEGWLDWVYNYTSTVYHPVGTATLGPLDKQGVVDPETLKIHGIENVRISDASIMPFIISGHIQTYVYAIAERAAALIKSEASS